MIVLIHELVVTVINRTVAVPVSVVDVVRIVVDGPVAVRVPSRWPEDPVSVEVVRVRAVDVGVPVVCPVVPGVVVVRVAVRSVVVVRVADRRVAVRTVVVPSVVVGPDRTVNSDGSPNWCAAVG